MFDGAMTTFAVAPETATIDPIQPDPSGAPDTVDPDTIQPDVVPSLEPEPGDTPDAAPDGAPAPV